MSTSILKSAMWHGGINREKLENNQNCFISLSLRIFDLVSLCLDSVSRKFLNDESKLTNFTSLNYRGIASLLKYIILIEGITNCRSTYDDYRRLRVFNRIHVYTTHLDAKTGTRNKSYSTNISTRIAKWL